MDKWDDSVLRLWEPGLGKWDHISSDTLKYRLEIWYFYSALKWRCDALKNHGKWV